MSAAEWTAVVLIWVAMSAGVVSPGPAFVMTAQTAVGKSRAHGLAVALGMGLGALAIGIACLAGLHALLAAAPKLFAVLKVAGGLYLVWIAVQIWRHAKSGIDLGPSSPASQGDLWRVGVLAFATQASNPKALVIYGSVMAALLPASLGFGAAVVLLAGLFLMEWAWYVLVVLVLSSPAPRAAYLRAKTPLDRFAAVVMGALGAKLISSAAAD